MLGDIMSLIIAYVGKKGCVMASDKRKIGYFGDKENLRLLESELYDGSISNDEDFLKRAKELGISTKITDDANKLKIIGKTIRGEVSTKGTFETRRRRIYGTTNGYQIIELLGSETESRNAGKSGLIIFGNEFAKQMAETLIKRKWKSSLSLRYMGEIFLEIIQEVASKTPTVAATPTKYESPKPVKKGPELISMFDNIDEFSVYLKDGTKYVVNIYDNIFYYQHKYYQIFTIPSFECTTMKCFSFFTNENKYEGITKGVNDELKQVVITNLNEVEFIEQTEPLFDIDNVILIIHTSFGEITVRSDLNFYLTVEGEGIKTYKIVTYSKDAPLGFYGYSNT